MRLFTENVTLCPTVAVEGKIVRTVVSAARIGEIFLKNPRKNVLVGVVA